MKSSLLLAGFAATLALASCSSNSTTETTTTTAPADSSATAVKTTTTRTYTDTDYHTRGDRMAVRFASQHKINDAATLAKLKTAYYNRAKRYDEMMTRYQADTAGMGQARRDYMKANDQEFQTVLTDQTQYQSYQSSSATPDYDESSNMDITNQTDAASSATMPDNSANGSTTTMTEETSTTSTTTGSDMPMGAGVAKGKAKMSDGSKVKVKDDGKVKMKDADGNKTKM